MGRGGRLDVRGWANQSLHLTRRLVLDFKLITSSAAVQVTSNRFVGQEQPLSMHEIGIVEADLNDPRHQSAVLCMMDAYSADPMGDAKPLSDFARLNLISGLRTHPTTLVFLAFRGDQPCGIATCFRGFSTFAAKPLINISKGLAVCCSKRSSKRQRERTAVNSPLRCNRTIHELVRSMETSALSKPSTLQMPKVEAHSTWSEKSRTYRCPVAVKPGGFAMDDQSSPPRDR